MLYRIRSISICPILLAVLTVSLVSACGSGLQAVANETWSLVKLLNTGERTDTVEEVIEVRNCGVVEHKTTECSAGTSSDLSVSLGGGIPGPFSGVIEAGIISGLGIGRYRGESLTLDPPPAGSIYQYTVKTEFHVKAGEMLARSSANKEQRVAYVFNANCSLKIESRDSLACQEGMPLPATAPMATPQPSAPPTTTPMTPPTTAPTTTPTPAPTTTPTPTPTTPPTSTPPPPTPTVEENTPSGSILEVGQAWKQNGVRLKLEEVKLKPNLDFQCMMVLFNLYNETDHEIIVTIKDYQFEATDNLQRQWPLRTLSEGGQGCRKGWIEDFSRTVAPGERLRVQYDAWMISFEGFLTDTGVSEVIVTVDGLSQISSARWRIPIYH